MSESHPKSLDTQPRTCEVDLGGRRLLLETGRMAKQANGSCVVRFGDTVVLATACANKEPREGVDFFPLTVDYKENTYAGGMIPGGWFKREGRPTEKETLTSRLIDRPLRPLFPEGFNCDTQVVALVLSADGENDPDVLAVNAASAALLLSDIPFETPIAAVRVGQGEQHLVERGVDVDDVDVAHAGVAHRAEITALASPRHLEQ